MTPEKAAEWIKILAKINIEAVEEISDLVAENTHYRNELGRLSRENEKLAEDLRIEMKKALQRNTQHINT